MTKHWLWNHIILDSILVCSPGTYSVAWVLEFSCSKSHLPYLLNKDCASKCCGKDYKNLLSAQCT